MFESSLGLDLKAPREHFLWSWSWSIRPVVWVLEKGLVYITESQAYYHILYLCAKLHLFIPKILLIVGLRRPYCSTTLLSEVLSSNNLN